MLLKAVLAANMPAIIVTILGLLGTQNNTSMVELSKQSVKQYKEIITQFTDNQAALKKQLNRQGYRAIKIPSVKWFSGEVYKLREFLI